MGEYLLSSLPLSEAAAASHQVKGNCVTSVQARRALEVWNLTQLLPLLFICSSQSLQTLRAGMCTSALTSCAISVAAPSYPWTGTIDEFQTHMFFPSLGVFKR